MSTKTAAKTATKPTPAAKRDSAAKPAAVAAPAVAARPANTQPQAAPNRKANTRVSTSGKSQAGALTREALATDIAAFKKAGGRIEVLGHTPLRPTASPRSTTKSPAQPPARTAARVP